MSAEPISIDRLRQLQQRAQGLSDLDLGETESADADRLASIFGDDLVYCPERKCYAVWNGRRWEQGNTLEVERLAERASLYRYHEVAKIVDTRERDKLLKHLRHSLSRSGLNAAVELAKKKVRVASINEFDAEPWILNCKNGIVDLRTGELKPHERDLMCSKLNPVNYDESAVCPRFEAFLYRILGGRDDPNRTHRLMDFLQRAFGCAATGKHEKAIFFLAGSGNNGKTTLVEAIRTALGGREYAGQMRTDSLMATGRESSNSNLSDVAALKGCRFVSCSEIERGRKLSPETVKYLTGGSEIKGRYLHENFIVFTPTHKIFVDCNNLPVIPDSKDAIWNRVLCVMFGAEIPREEIDTELGNKLREELPGILAWIVRGAVQYSREGLNPPIEVRAATEHYRAESDSFPRFLAEVCVTHIGNPDCYLSFLGLLDRYAGWCEENEKESVSQKVIAEELRRIGCNPARRRIAGEQQRVWIGIRFRAPDDEERELRKAA